MRHALLAILLLISVLGLQAQDPDTPPTFEVASVSRNASGATGFTVSDRPNGGVTATNVFVGTLIARAYPPAVPGDAHSTHRDQSVHAIVITGTTAS